MSAPNQTFRLPDGRELGYDDWGQTEGPTLFYFHGSPSARVDAAMFSAPWLAERLGARIIAVDRPGLGLSTCQPGRRFGNWPADVACLADSLGLERFAVLSHSGGGPYALACALALPQRLTAVGVVSGTGPFGEPGLAKGINPNSRRFMDLCAEKPRLARLMLRVMGIMARHMPGRMAAQAGAALPEPDRAVIGRREVAAAFVRAVREALRQGPKGAQVDTALMVGPWDLTPGEIRVRLLLWHGEQDRNAPPAMGRYLATAIPDCAATFMQDEGHLSLIVNHAEAIIRAILQSGS